MGLPWQKSSPGAALLICQDIRQRSNNNKNRNRQPAGRQGQKKNEQGQHRVFAVSRGVEGSPRAQDPLIDNRQISFGIYQWNREDRKDLECRPPGAMMNRGICVFTRNLTGPTRIWLS